MTKRRPVTAREPNGRIQREREYPPAQVRRLRDAAMRGLRDPEWGTELGRLYLEGTITEAMYAAGKRWAREAEQYKSAIGVFPVRSASLERGSFGHDPDPESDEGKKQALRESNGAERFFEAHAYLTLMGGQKAEQIVRKLCEHGELPVGFEGYRALRNGLGVLVNHYNLTNQRV